MTIKNCENCGGTHYGVFKCPYTKAPCVVCGDQTIWACSDCAIGSSERVHICEKSECRDEHEHLKHMPEKPKDNFAKAQEDVT